MITGGTPASPYVALTGFVMKVLNGGGLQSVWERVVNGLHKALFIRALAQPAPVPVRRRDIQ